LIGLRRIAERRRDNRQVVVLQPSRGEHEVIADRVVQRQRRLHEAGGDDECEQGEGDRGDRPRHASQWTDAGIVGRRNGERQRETGRAETQIRHQSDQTEAAEEQSREDDRRESDDRRADERVGQPAPRVQGTGEPPGGEDRQSAEQPEGKRAGGAKPRNHEARPG
jgi:hypothetical protein